MTTTKLSENLKKLMHEMEITVSELARRTGITQPVLHRFVSGKTYNPNVLSIIPVANFFGVTVNQLLGNEPISKERIVGSYNLEHARLNEVPLIDWESLSNWNGLENFNLDMLNHNKMIKTERNVNQLTFALNVVDSSMEPKFSENTIIIVDPYLKPKNKNFVIAFRHIQGIATFKQVLSDGENFYLKPYNNLFQPILMDKYDSIIGVVIEARFDVET